MSEKTFEITAKELGAFVATQLEKPRAFPVMTDRAKLAEKLFIETHQPGMEGCWYKNKAQVSIFAANIFFDTLEGSNNEDG